MRISKVVSCLAVILMLSGCGIRAGAARNVVNSATEAAVKAAEKKVDLLQIEEHYLSLNREFANSSEDGFNTALNATYPGTVDKQISESCIKTLIEKDIQWRFKPDLDSITRIETWVAPNVSRDDKGEWLFAGKTPQGRTYELQESNQRLIKGVLTSSPSGTVHLTIFNEEVYLFTSFCANRW